jgi:maltose O-acetyltransferase
MRILDLLFKGLSRLRDVCFWALRQLFIGHLGKGSYLKPGVRLVGNPYRIRIGKNFKVWEDTVLSVGKGTINIGDNGLIGVGSFINAGNNIIHIGNGVAIAPNCQIMAYSHHYFPGKSITESYTEANVSIEDNVLIGAGVIILPGVKIGKGAIVGAGALVNKDVLPNTIVGGIPAKKIKDRVL